MNLKCDAQTRRYHCYHHERHPLSLLSSIDLVLYRRMYLQAIIHDVQSCIYVDSLSNSPVWMRFIGLDAIYSIFIKQLEKIVKDNGFSYALYADMLQTIQSCHISNENTPKCIRGYHIRVLPP